MPKVLIIGDSHTQALKRAQAARATSTADFEIHWIENDRRSAGTLPVADAVRMVGDLGPQDLCVLTLLGTVHGIYGFLKADPPFTIGADAYFPPETTPPPVMITEALMRHLFGAANRSNVRLKTIRAAIPCRAIHLAPCPPVADNAILERKIETYRNKVVAKTGINPPPLRLKLWQIEMAAVRTICEELQIEHLGPPPEALDNGYLRPEYLRDDATHANAAYGELVLRQLEALVGLELATA